MGGLSSLCKLMGPQICPKSVNSYLLEVKGGGGGGGNRHLTQHTVFFVNKTYWVYSFDMSCQQQVILFLFSLTWTNFYIYFI